MRGQAILILIERLFVGEAGDGAMGVVEIGRATGGTGIILVVETGVEGNAGGGGVVDGLRRGVGALQVEAIGEAMDQGGLQGVIVGVGIWNEGLIGTGGK